MLAIRITGNRKRITSVNQTHSHFLDNGLHFLDNHLRDLCLGLHSLPYSSPMSTTWSPSRAAEAFLYFVGGGRRGPHRL
jgi:hypothetical protein